LYDKIILFKYLCYAHGASSDKHKLYIAMQGQSVSIYN